MRLNHLTLTNFRNFKHLDLAIPAGLTVVVGANAQGKTSLLEGIHYLAGASSPHTSSDRQLIHFEALGDQPPVARVIGEHRGSAGPGRIEIRVILEPRAVGQDPRLRKEILINGIKRRARQLHGNFLTVLFLPQDLRAIEGPPSERRRLLDEALFQGEPGYAAQASEYAKVVTQRNALLKTMAMGSGQRDRRSAPPEDAGTGSGGQRQLAFWNERLVGLASRLMRARGHMLAELQELAEPIHQTLTRGRESLRLEYQPSFDPFAGEGGTGGAAAAAAGDHPEAGWGTLEGAALEGSLAAALQGMRGQEIQRGMTLLGPHRDEVGFSVNEVDLRAYGSRGQNRTAMLAFKLAEVEWLRQRVGENPVLLLDEVLAELDPERRADLLEHIGTADQAILTAADPEMFGEAFLGAASVWRIEAGVVLQGDA